MDGRGEHISDTVAGGAAKVGSDVSAKPDGGPRHELDRLVQIVPVPTVITQRDGSILRVNRRAEALFGVTGADACRRNAAEFWADPVARNDYLKAMARDGAVEEIELELLRADGSTFTGLLSAAVFHDREGEELFVVSVADISQRRRAEAALQSLIEHAPFPIIVTDPADQSVIMINQNAAELFGVPVEEAEGKVAPDFWVEPERRQALLAELKSSGKVDEFEAELKTATGRRFWALLSAVIFPFGDRPAVYVAFSEISARKALEERLEIALRQAERANSAKSQFLANMSHELRTPLNAVIGFSQILSGQVYGDIGNEKYVEYARDIENSGQLLLSLVNDILDHAKAEAGRIQLACEPCDFRQLVEGCRQLMAEWAKTDGVSLEVYLPDELPVLNVDPKRVKQVLLNLLTNAVKFNSRGGTVTIVAENCADASGEGGFVFRVADTGQGISAADLDRIFEVFEQAGVGQARSHDGVGLGLPLSKHLVELHGGRIDVESTPGEGTTVSVILPPSCIQANVP